MSVSALSVAAAFTLLLAQNANGLAAAAASAESTPSVSIGPIGLGISFPTIKRGFASEFTCKGQTCQLDVYTTDDTGVAWQQVAEPIGDLSSSQVDSYRFGETPNDVVFANQYDGVLLFADPARVLVTHDGGTRWTDVHVRGVAIQALVSGGSFLVVLDYNSKCLPGFLLPRCSPDAIARLPIGGAHVVSVSKLPSCLTSNVAGIGPLLMAAGCGAFYRSDDWGTTWQRSSTGWYATVSKYCETECGATLLSADSPSDVWALVPGNPAGQQSQIKYIYKSVNGGVGWRLIDQSRTDWDLKGDEGNVPLSAHGFRLVAISPNHAVLVSTTGGNWVAASFDGGRKWISRALQASAGGLVCVGPEHCWTQSWSQVLRSEDGGRRWTGQTLP